MDMAYDTDTVRTGVPDPAGSRFPLSSRNALMYGQASSHPVSQPGYPRNKTRLPSPEDTFFMANLFPSIAIIIFYTHLLTCEKNCSWGDCMSAIKTYAVYKDGMLVLEDPVNLPEHTRVEVVIRKKFSEFVKKFGEPEAKEDIDQLLLKNRRRMRDV